MLNLREAHQLNAKNCGGSDTPSEEDVVLVKSQSPRTQWKLGRIKKLIEGRDGMVRAARVKQASGVEMRRPLQHLFPLEIRNGTLLENETTNIVNEEVSKRRSKRNAARIAMERIHSNFNDYSGGEDVGNPST